MLRGLVTLALAVGVGGCVEDAEVEELKGYVRTLQGFGSHNLRIEQYIDCFGDPATEVTAQDLAGARALLEEYADAVKAVPPLSESALRDAHGVYVRALDDACRLAREEGGDRKREVRSVAGGLRSLRRDIDGRLFPAVEVLLGKHNLEGEEYQLRWPARG